jgi:signal transduction histidine kinase
MSARHRLSRQTIDLVFTAVAVASFVSVRLSLANAPDHRDLDALAVVLTAAMMLPVSIRRRAPLAAVAAAMAFNAVGIGIDEPEIGVTLVAYALAFSSAASVQPMVKTASRLVPVIALGLTTQALAGTIHNSAGQLGSNLVTDVVGFALALAFGDNLRRRRLRVRELEDRARLIEHERQLELQAAKSEERTRIARELHDIVAHGVSLIVVQAGAGQRVVRRDAEAGFEALVGIEQTARSAMTEMRALLDVLRDRAVPATVDPPQPSLDQLAELVTSDLTGPINLTEIGARPVLGAQQELAAFRIVQEALTNARKHSPGCAVNVTVNYEHNDIDIAVDVERGGTTSSASDFIGEAGPSPIEQVGTAGELGHIGHGLIGMRERAELCGGSLEAGPGPDGEGWHVHARLPFRTSLGARS